MSKSGFSIFFLFSFFIFSGVSFSQSFNVVHVQTWQIKAGLGDEAEAFNDMLKRQSDVINKDSRVLRSYVLRHFWGADSRDLIFVNEFDTREDLFSFYDDLNSLFEKAFSEEQRNKDNELFNKFVGMHSDEIYQVVEGTRK